MGRKPKYETVDDVDFVVEERDVLAEIKRVFSECNRVTYMPDKRALRILFPNGQTFRVGVTETKKRG